jgi:hypothetical protein
MDNMNASKHLVLASAAVVLGAAIGVFWLVGGKKPSQAPVTPSRDARQGSPLRQRGRSRNSHSAFVIRWPQRRVAANVHVRAYGLCAASSTFSFDKSERSIF